MKVNITGFFYDTDYEQHIDTREIDFVFDLDEVLVKSLAVLYAVPEDYFTHKDLKDKNIILLGGITDSETHAGCVTPNSIMDKYRDFVYSQHSQHSLLMQHFVNRLQKEIDYNIEADDPSDINAVVINIRYDTDAAFIKNKGGIVM